MKKLVIFSLAIATLGSIVSCSPFNIRSDYASTADFNSYKTYKLRIDDLKLNDIDKDRVLNEISKQLKTKGLSVAENPDLIINIKARHKKVQDIQSSSPYGMWNWGYPWGWGFGVSHTWTSNYNQGGLIVDFIDSKSQKLVWQATGDGIYVDSPNKKQKQIPKMVEELLANYPPKK